MNVCWLIDVFDIKCVRQVRKVSIPFLAFDKVLKSTYFVSRLVWIL